MVSHIWPTWPGIELKQLGLEAMVEKKGRRLLYAPILKLQKGMVSGLMKSVMNENQSQSQVLATALRYLRFKPGKWGLNSPFTCPAGGGGFSHITLSRDWKWTVNTTLVKGHHAETRHTARNSFSFQRQQYTNNIYTLFCDWGRRYSQVRFPAIQRQHVSPTLLGLKYTF
jgi:hypothetical protein